MLDFACSMLAMPRRPDPRTIADENRAFLRQLRRTGNAHAAADALGMSRSRFTKRRAGDPGFAARWDAALAAADAGLASDPRLVRTPSGRAQLRRKPASAITPEAEQRFLLALSATANVRLSAAAAGFTHASFYALKRRDPAFAREWRSALEQGCARLEAELINTALANDEDRDAWSGNEPPAIPPMTFSQALQLLYLHQKERLMLDEPPHLKRRRGESREAHSFRLSQMYEAQQERARVAFRIAEHARQQRGEGSPHHRDVTLPDLAQVTGWSKADPTKVPHNPKLGLFGGWRLQDWKDREK